MQDCYKLMCLVAPEVVQYEEGIQTLQTETAARKASTREKEDALEQQNLPIFQQIQVRQPPSHGLQQTGAGGETGNGADNGIFSLGERQIRIQQLCILLSGPPPPGGPLCALKALPVSPWASQLQPVVQSRGVEMTG